MIVSENKIYPRDDHESVYLKNVINDSNILVGGTGIKKNAIYMFCNGLDQV